MRQKKVLPVSREHFAHWQLGDKGRDGEEIYTPQESDCTWSKNLILNSLPVCKISARS